MNELRIGSIGVNLNDENGRMSTIYHVGREFVYFQYINSPVQGLCKIVDYWVLM